MTKKISLDNLQQINLNAAGIDIGCNSHFVAVQDGTVKEFGSFTQDLEDIAACLSGNNVTTVAMESTGVYWIPLFELLETKGFEVILVNPRHIKNVSGRKTDVLDCQWIQQLHTYGLLQAAFRPDENFAVLRTFLRQRKVLIQKASKEILHIDKALQQMNVKLGTVTTSLTQKTPQKIIRAIANGETNPAELAKLRHDKCKYSVDDFKKALSATYYKQHLLTLKQSLRSYDLYQEQIEECDIEIKVHLQKILNGESKAENFDNLVKEVSGVDLTAIEGVSTDTALTVISEVGLDMSKFPSAKHFASWLNLCPNNKISGGKTLSSKIQKKKNRAAQALRISAMTVHRSQTALGAFFRRIKSRGGAQKAVTATAHKIAIYIYHMLNSGEEYVKQELEQYEEKFKESMLKNLQHKAQKLGYSLVSTN